MAIPISNLSAAARPARPVRTLSPRALMWRKFRRHRLAVASLAVVGLFYLVAALCGFVAPYDPEYKTGHPMAAPQWPQLVVDGRIQWPPVVYGISQTLDMKTFQRSYLPDRTKPIPVTLLPQGATWYLLGLVPTDRHLFGTAGGSLYLMGTDALGRDLFSRVVYGARISLSVGLVGVAISLALGILLGGISGYFGGRTDMLIQRLIEVVQSFPSIPLWMALAAALPSTWSTLQVYFGITVILSVIGWTDLARVVRGRFLSLRQEDFVLAAKLCGASEARIILRHLLPSFMSHIIASVTLSIPGMILAETSLSFLGIGLTPPAISWGVLLQSAQNVNTLVSAPWLLLPGGLVVITVLAFNFIGDGLRDAADPYTQADA